MPDSNIIQIDQNLFETKLDRLVTEKMTQILNAMLDAEADEITGAARYERKEGRKAYRAGHYGRPFPVTGRRLGEHVAHEVHHAPLVFRVRQHRVDRGDESGAPVADHQSDAPQPAFDHASEELLPAGLSFVK